MMSGENSEVWQGAGGWIIRMFVVLIVISIYGEEQDLKIEYSIRTGSGKKNSGQQ